MHVLERERRARTGPRSRPGDPSQLGCLPGDTSGPPPSASTTVSVSSPSRRARATDAATASVANASQVFFTSFSRDPSRQVPPRSFAGRARRTAESEHAHAPRPGPTRRSSAGLFCRVLASRHRRVEEHHVRTLSIRPWPRRGRSPPRRSCSSAPRPRPAQAQRASPGPGRSKRRHRRRHHRDHDRGLRAASAAVPATSAPSSARSRHASGSRFQTIVGIPARRALVAMPWPIAPMPRTATGSFAGS